MPRIHALGVVLGLVCAALVAGCAGDRMSGSTAEGVDDHLLANKVKVALYADKQVRSRQIVVEAAQGVVQLRGIVDSPAERERAYRACAGDHGGESGPRASDGARGAPVGQTVP